MAVSALEPTDPIIRVRGVTVQFGANKILDGLYKLVRNDESFNPDSFVTALRDFQTALDRGTP